MNAVEPLSAQEVNALLPRRWGLSVRLDPFHRGLGLSVSWCAYAYGDDAHAWSGGRCWSVTLTLLPLGHLFVSLTRRIGGGAE